MKYSVIIPTFNKVDLLTKCIDSINLTSNLDETEIIVVSNGCKDGTWEYLKTQPHVKRFRFFDALGYAGAVNVGIQQAEGEYLVLLNNDAVILDYCPRGAWLNMLCTPLTENRRVAITGVSILAFLPNQNITMPQQYAGDKFWIPFIPFFCAMFPRWLVDEIGLLDTAFSPGMGEDVDYCLKAIQKKYTIETVPSNKTTWSFDTNFPIYHPGGATLGNRHDIYEKNVRLLADRWRAGFYGEKDENGSRNAG